MSEAALLRDVFTVDEVARAAGVPRTLARSAAESGALPTIPGTVFVAPAVAVEAVRRLRGEAAALADAALVERPLFAPASGTVIRARGARVSLYISTAFHTAALGLLLWLAAIPSRSVAAAAAPPLEPVRMVFLMTPGPGGGGGGGGMQAPQPPARLARRGADRTTVEVPITRPERVLASRRPLEEPTRPAPSAPPVPLERAPEPLPSRAIVAPVVATAASERDREGAMEESQGTDSRGPGAGGGAGTGHGRTGSGQGTGAGIGEGFGGGTGGGPYRPGSGIQPPRLLREVKAQYTDEARRRNITGDVLLEVVVTREGAVGDVHLLQGLGAGLDERAIAAVRQWRFEPARRQGRPVDVLVEVAVAFTLR